MLLRASDVELVEFWTRGDGDASWATDKSGNTYQVKVAKDGSARLVEAKYIPSPNPANGTIPLSSLEEALENAQPCNFE